MLTSCIYTVTFYVHYGKTVGIKAGRNLLKWILKK